MAEFPMMPLWGERFFGDGNVMAMMGEEIGAHICLCWYAWQHNGRIPKDPQVLMCIARTRNPDWPRIWGKLKTCYADDPNDSTLYVQWHVFEQLEKARKQVADASKAGRASVKARGYRHIGRRTSVPSSVEQPIERSGVMVNGVMEPGVSESGAQRNGDERESTLTDFLTAGVRCGLPATEATKCFHHYGKTRRLAGPQRVDVNHAVAQWTAIWRERLAGKIPAGANKAEKEAIYKAKAATW